MIRAVGYVRVSTELQASEGVSLDAQRGRIAGWCAVQGFDADDVAMFADEGISGKRADNRPGLKLALEAACAAPCALVVYSLSRMARSVRDSLAISERLRLAGADMVSLCEAIDTTTANGRMLFGLFSVLSEFERDLISERTRGGLAYKRSKGERVGKVPRGSALGPDGRTLVIDEAESAQIRTMVALAGQGLGNRAIARHLTHAGFRWSESTVRRILARRSP